MIIVYWSLPRFPTGGPTLKQFFGICDVHEREEPRYYTVQYHNHAFQLWDKNRTDLTLANYLYIEKKHDIRETDSEVINTAIVRI